MQPGGVFLRHHLLTITVVTIARHCIITDIVNAFSKIILIFASLATVTVVIERFFMKAMKLLYD